MTIVDRESKFNQWVQTVNERKKDLTIKQQNWNEHKEVNSKLSKLLIYILNLYNIIYDFNTFIKTLIPTNKSNKTLWDRLAKSFLPILHFCRAMSYPVPISIN